MAKILVVDDEPDQRFLLNRALCKQGHDVTLAENGAVGLSAVRKEIPDLVVTDIMMPVMNGAEFIGRLRVDPATAHILILVASADVQLAGAADAILRKPYRDHQLITIVNALLEKGRDKR